MQRKHSSKLKEYDPTICNQCGICCHMTVKVMEQRILLRKVTCIHLKDDSDNDGDKTRCEVYKDRFKKAPWCMSLSESYEQRKLPNSCPYVKDDPTYVGENYVPRHIEASILPTVLLQIKDKPIKLWEGPTGE